jgi:hypothetical protein
MGSPRCGLHAADTGVEWDWLNSFRNVNRGGNASDMNDLHSIYDGACFGDCRGKQPTFEELAHAADLTFDPGSDKAQKFLNTGIFYGVN